jgi:TetR/AcrR family transcriptional regulator, cholesterol catabolism regulator
MSSFQKPPTVSDDQRAVDIYRKAADILHARGFVGTSMGDIAETVDLTKGGLYYYIKGKEALLFAIVNFAMDLIEKEVMAPAESENDPQERLRKIIAAHLRLILREPSTMALLVNDVDNLSADHRSKVVARKTAFVAFLRATLEQVSPHGDSAIKAFSLLGMLHWTVRWYRPDGALDAEEVIAQMTRLALRGLLG